MVKLSDDEEERRRDLYEEGLSDPEIADRVGVTPSAIAQWRKRRELKPKGAGPKTLSGDEEERRRALYEKGLSDPEIADRIGISRSAVQSWRQDRDLPPNEPARADWDEARTDEMWEAYKDDLTDPEIAERVGRTRSAVSKWRARYDLPNRADAPGNLPMREHLHRLLVWATSDSDAAILDRVGLSSLASVHEWRETFDLPPPSRVDPGPEMDEIVDRVVLRLIHDGPPRPWAWTDDQDS